ncbi:hypothetical protein AVEN_71458-1 [Araneus ventricosus]|uniref:Transposase Tc1-like domain-containing protein n=1 Tax=Araneus ventricosus TaxID=182803 RepID=A0A4Y2CV79_ARAVE|nr:hypothetical protein AVEN_71458-1 [Araneus ventricosus]
MRRTTNHNLFAGLHWRLAETGSFQRFTMNWEPSVRTPNIEDNPLHQVQETPSLSTRSVAHAAGISSSSVWRILRENEMHLHHVQRVQTLQPGD